MKYLHTSFIKATLKKQGNAEGGFMLAISKHVVYFEKEKAKNCNDIFTANSTALLQTLRHLSGYRIPIGEVFHFARAKHVCGD